MDPENLFLSGFRNPDCTARKVVAVSTGTSRRPFVQLQRCKLSRIYGDKGRMFSGGRTGEYVEK
jgi:hypothetical protein